MVEREGKYSNGLPVFPLHLKTLGHTWGEEMNEGNECVQGEGTKGQGHKRPCMPPQGVQCR